MSMEEANGELSISIRVNASSPEAALQLNQIVSGFVAMANLTAARQPDNAWMVNLSKNMDISIKGKTMTMNLALPIGDVIAAIKEKTAKHRGE